MFEVIEHLPRDPVDVLKDIFRILRKGGLLFLSTPNFMRLENRIAIIKGVNPIPYEEFDPQRGGGHFREYSLNEILYMLKKAGFSVVWAHLTDFRPFQKGMKTLISGILRRLISSLRSHIIVVAKKSNLENYYKASEMSER